MLQNKVLEICKGKNIIGIGTGSTVESILKYLDPTLKYVSSSYSTTLSLSEYKIDCLPIESVSNLDLYIDGCDYFDSNNNLIKGKGGSLTTEKLLSSMSPEIVIFAQKYKCRQNFEDCLVPIEILPQSLRHVEGVLNTKKIQYKLRNTQNKCGPLITDLGNFILDTNFDLKFLSNCKNICGVVENGYFSSNDYNTNVIVI